MENALLARERSRFAILRDLPDVFRLSLKMLDTSSLLRFSEVDARARQDEISSKLFRHDICVHCGTCFSPIDNRTENCLQIANKKHRRHKGERAANKRELRNLRELVAQRQRILGGKQWYVDDDIKETCGRCRKHFLPYQVADSSWLENVQESERDLCLCMGCYLGNTPHACQCPRIWLSRILFALLGVLASALGAWQALRAGLRSGAIVGL